MALPTLPSSWSNRYQDLERQTKRIREQHQMYTDQWQEASAYYKRNNNATTKRDRLFSAGTSQKSSDVYMTLQEKSNKAAVMQRRREKLRHLLKTDAEVFTAELKGLSVQNSSRLNEMKEKTEALKSSREEKRKQIASEKLYQHWKENNPELREVASEIHRNHVKEAWGSQLEGKLMEQAKDRETEMQFANQYEKARLVAIENMKKKEEEKRKEDEERAKVLQQQIKDMKEREQAAIALRKEEEKIIQEQWDLEKLKDERRKIERKRQNTQHQRFLHNQYKAQMRKRARQIQEELELDHQILKMLQLQEEKQKQINSARQQKVREDLEWMRQVVEEQMKLEKQREAELDLIYREEARRVWDQREAEWRKERVAREKLMTEVMNDRSEQMEALAEQNREKQRQLLQEREELLLNMEEIQKSSRLEKEEAEKKKLAVREEIENAITERLVLKEAIEQDQQRQLEDAKQLDTEYEKVLAEEKERMKEEGFTDRTRPRSVRSAW